MLGECCLQMDLDILTVPSNSSEHVLNIFEDVLNETWRRRSMGTNASRLEGGDLGQQSVLLLGFLCCRRALHRLRIPVALAAGRHALLRPL